MTFRKLLTVIVYTVIMLFIGRNLTSLPRFHVFTSSDPKKVAENNAGTVKTAIKKLLLTAAGNYSVYFVDLKNNTHVGISEKEMFTGASINKVHIISALYYLENKGKIDLDEKITLQEKDIQDYGTGSLRYQKPGSVYSLKTLAKMALKESDNTAARIIALKIGVEQIQSIMERFGLTQTDMENNKTSNYDMYVLMKRIYEGKVTNKGKTQELLSFMTDTDIEDRLPSLLPPGVTIYHKTGDTVGGLHDVGIIAYKDHLFYIGVFTSDITDEKKTKQTIGEIARTIIDTYKTRE
jgi:beta-lactamase class A